MILNSFSQSTNLEAMKENYEVKPVKKESDQPFAGTDGGAGK